MSNVNVHEAKTQLSRLLARVEKARGTGDWFKRLSMPDRKSAALQIIEAIRAHGKVPATLADVALPLPVDPATGQPFEYRAREGGFTLTSRIEGGEPADEMRYEVTMK